MALCECRLDEHAEDVWASPTADVTGISVPNRWSMPERTRFDVAQEDHSWHRLTATRPCVKPIPG